MAENDVGERLARLESGQSEMRQDVKDLLRKIDGPPWEHSIRQRLHDAENTIRGFTMLAENFSEFPKHAEKIATRAAEDAVRRSNDARAKQRREDWKSRLGLMGTGAGVVVAGVSVLELLMR